MRCLYSNKKNVLERGRGRGEQGRGGIRKNCKKYAVHITRYPSPEHANLHGTQNVALTPILYGCTHTYPLGGLKGGRAQGAGAQGDSRENRGAAAPPRRRRRRRIRRAAAPPPPPPPPPWDGWLGWLARAGSGRAVPLHSWGPGGPRAGAEARSRSGPPADFGPGPRAEARPRERGRASPPPAARP